MKSLNKLLFAAVGAIAFATIGVTGAVAHEADEISFSGTANEACLHPGTTHWTVTWTIHNSAGSNPFGIVDTDPDVGFAPLVDDAAPGAYIPAGASASAVSIHPVGQMTASLTVWHDVTGAAPIPFMAEVDRPPLCEQPSPFDPDFGDDLKLEIENELNNINQNINKTTNTNTNTNVNENTQNQTNEQNTNVSTGDVNVSSTGGSGTGTGFGGGHGHGHGHGHH